MEGLEPAHLSALDPKSSSSANSDTPARLADSILADFGLRRSARARIQIRLTGGHDQLARLRGAAPAVQFRFLAFKFLVDGKKVLNLSP